MKKFNPETSKTIKRLNEMTDYDLVKRYIKRHHTNSPSLRAQFKEELNRADEDNNFIYSAVTILCDTKRKLYANINYIYDELFKKYYSTLIDLGYQFRVDRLLSDLTDLFNEDTESTLEASDLPDRVLPYVKDIVAAFDQILDTKVIVPLKTNSIKNLNI